MMQPGTSPSSQMHSIGSSGSAPNVLDFPERDQNVHQLQLCSSITKMKWCCINSQFKLQISRSTMITPTWGDCGHIKEEAQTKILREVMATINTSIFLALP
jgi:hypothetical protein